MKLIFLLIFFNLFFIQNSHSLTIANCGPSKGISYFTYSGITSKEDSGFENDGISEGSVTLSKNSELYDILYKDATGTIASSRQEGAEIYPIILNPLSITLASIYPGEVIEIYSFWIESDGSAKYSLQASRHTNPLINKSSLFVGDCSFLNIQ